MTVAGWAPVGNEFVYDGDPGTHQWYDGTAHPWEFRPRLAPGAIAHDPETAYGGGRTRRCSARPMGGWTWQELAGLRDHGTGPVGNPARVGSVCTPSCWTGNPGRTLIAISAAGRLSDGRRGPDVASHQPRAASRSIFGRIRRPSWATAFIAGHAPSASGRAVHAEALGCDA